MGVNSLFKRTFLLFIIARFAFDTAATPQTTLDANANIQDELESGKQYSILMEKGDKNRYKTLFPTSKKGRKEESGTVSDNRSLEGKRILPELSSFISSSFTRENDGIEKRRKRDADGSNNMKVLDKIGKLEDGSLVEINDKLDDETTKGEIVDEDINILADNYMPEDVALYILLTGDESGVTTIIREFLKKGIIGREEAVIFLEEVQTQLDLLNRKSSVNSLKSRLSSPEGIDSFYSINSGGDKENST